MLEISLGELLFFFECIHVGHAKYGWYRYDVRFAIPVYSDTGKLERYNIFAARLLVNHSANGKKYLYDILNIKKANVYLVLILSLIVINVILIKSKINSNAIVVKVFIFLMKKIINAY